MKEVKATAKGAEGAARDKAKEKAAKLGIQLEKVQTQLTMKEENKVRCVLFRAVLYHSCGGG